MTLSPSRFALRSYAGRQAAHCHAYHQMVLPARGVLELRIDDQEGKVDSACAAIIKAGQRHAFRGLGDNRFLVVDFEPDLPWAAVDAPEFLPIDEGLRQLTSFFGQELSSAAPDAVTGRHWAAVLSSAVARRLEPSKPLLPDPVRRAMAHMAASLGDPLRLEEIARSAGVSPSHLRALFRQHLGTTVWQHLAELRLAAARRLLDRGDVGLAEVAARCGFSDQSALTRAMGRRLGITPGAYKARLDSVGRRICQ